MSQSRATAGVVPLIRTHLLHRLPTHEATRQRAMVSAFLEAGIRPPRNLLLLMPITALHRLDHDMVIAISHLVRRTSMSMSDLVTLWRGETPTDLRPSKALDPT